MKTYMRRMFFQHLEERDLFASIIDGDVNGDGNLGALDALIVINELNQNGHGPFGKEQLLQNPLHYYDVNDDGKTTPADVLAVIDLVNANAESLNDAEWPAIPGAHFWGDVNNDGLVTETDLDILIQGITIGPDNPFNHPGVWYDTYMNGVLTHKDIQCLAIALNSEPALDSELLQIIYEAKEAAYIQPGNNQILGTFAYNNTTTQSIRIKISLSIDAPLAARDLVNNIRINGVKGIGYSSGSGSNTPFEEIKFDSMNFTAHQEIQIVADVIPSEAWVHNSKINVWVTDPMLEKYDPFNKISSFLLM